MKRSGPPKRRTPLKPSRGPKARSKAGGRRLSATKPRLSYTSASIAHARNPSGRCACGCGQRATEWHHVFEQKDFPELADEPDNVIAVASICHSRHTNRFRRLPRKAIWRAERLATTEKMKSYLDRVYGPLEEES